MKVDVEQGSGFCFGVENAVSIAEDALRDGEQVYCLGEIVHNDIEVARLTALGLRTITQDEFERLHNCKVLIRARITSYNVCYTKLLRHRFWHLSLRGVLVPME